MSTITVEKLSKTFGKRQALKGVSLEIEKGEMVALIGASGSGKSTLLRHIAGLVTSDAGDSRVVVEGNVMQEGGRLSSNAKDLRCEIGVIFQQFNLVDRLDVLSNVLIGRLANHNFLGSMMMRFSDAERTMAIQALDRLGLVPQALQRAGTLSGGQQQRVAIAKALVQQPKIMLADEPIASLDPANATLVMDGLRAINREDGITVLANLHTLDTARAYCDRILALRQGQVMFDGPAHQLTNGVVRDIYGHEGFSEFNEAVTSTQSVRLSA